MIVQYKWLQFDIAANDIPIGYEPFIYEGRQTARLIETANGWIKLKLYRRLKMRLVGNNE